jgi:hypothetical protein
VSSFFRVIDFLMICYGLKKIMPFCNLFIFPAVIAK